VAKRTDVGRRLRSLRARLRLTQEVVAGRSHTSAKFVSQIENDRVNPTIGALRRIIELGLEIPLSTFFAEPGEQRDELAQLQALLSEQTPAMRRRVLRVIRALVED
jgi:transcriptional regulator with XRE-family HTH domain